MSRSFPAPLLVALSLLLCCCMLLPHAAALADDEDPRMEADGSGLVVFNAAGGHFADGRDTVTTMAVITDEGLLITAPEAPQRTYYIFAGWTMGELLLSAESSVILEPLESGSYVFLAAWRPDPETAAVLTLEPGEAVLEERSLLVAPDGAARLPTLYRRGYSFRGWCADPLGASTVYEGGALLPVPRDLLLYALWEEAVCQVTISVKHLGRSVTDISYALLLDAAGNSIPGETNGTGVFVFSAVPDGVYTLQLSDRVRQGTCGEITVENGRVIGAELEMEMR